MKFKTKSTVNKKWVRVEDLRGGGKKELELDINVLGPWEVKPNSGIGKVHIDVSPDNTEGSYVRYLANLLVEDGDCIEIDDKTALQATPVDCPDQKDHQDTKEAEQA